MLPRRYRLRGKQQGRRVQASPIIIRGSTVNLRLARRGDQGPPRVAIAVGRHVSTKSVDRHLVTRWLREAIRPELPRLTPGVDLRFSATAPLSQYTFRQCVAEVRGLLARAHLVREPAAPAAPR